MNRPAHRNRRPLPSHSLCGLVIAPILGLLVSPLLGADPPLPSDVTFNLRQTFLQELMDGGPNGHSMGARRRVEPIYGTYNPSATRWCQRTDPLKGDCDGNN